MSKSGFDPELYKSNQRRDWDAVAGGWMKWRDVLESGAAPVTERLLDFSGAAPGQRILDIACGTGETTLACALRVMPQGQVVALDQSPGMLAAAQTRARERGIGNISFRAADGETLPGLAPGFDAVVSRWGLMFLPDIDAALHRIAQLLRPERRLAFAVWSEPERVPSISLPLRVLGNHVEIAPPPPGTPGPFSLADSDELRRRLTKAGFEPVLIEEVAVVFELPSARAYTDMSRDIAAPVISLVDSQPEQDRPALWEEITRAAEAFALADGSVRFENTALCVAATRA